jgi:hypothetical protein
MNTKVWTYTIGKHLTEQELNDLLLEGKAFANAWTAHEQQLEASFEIYKNKIIVVKVNEDVNHASGCSIDKLSRFMKEVGGKYNFDPLNRFLIALKKEDGIEVVHSSKIKELIAQNHISENSFVYNTSVANQHEFAQWEQALKNTWLNKYL